MQRILDSVQPNTLSEISRDIGQVFFASMVVGQIVEKSGVNWVMTFGGLILSLIFWMISITIIKK